MQFLSILAALVTLGFAFTLSRSRRADDRYGIVLVLLPLALATPLLGIMASGLVLIYAFRNAASTEGLGALELATRQAADAQLIGHVTLVALLAALALIALVLAVSRPVPEKPVSPAPTDEPKDDEEPNEDEEDAPKALSRFAVPLMVIAILVCIVAVATLSEFQARFIDAPLAFVTAFDTRDVGEFSTSRRAVEEQQVMGTNTLVMETFRTLVVAMLFLVLFDAFLVGSRTVTFNRTSAIIAIVLVALASLVSIRKVMSGREVESMVEERLTAVAKARAESKLEAETKANEQEEPEQEGEPVTTPGVEVVPPRPR